MRNTYCTLNWDLWVKQRMREATDEWGNGRKRFELKGRDSGPVFCRVACCVLRGVKNPGCKTRRIEFCRPFPWFRLCTAVPRFQRFQPGQRGEPADCTTDLPEKISPRRIPREISVGIRQCGPLWEGFCCVPAQQLNNRSTAIHAERDKEPPLSADIWTATTQWLKQYVPQWSEENWAKPTVWVSAVYVTEIHAGDCCWGRTGPITNGDESRRCKWADSAHPCTEWQGTLKTRRCWAAETTCGPWGVLARFGW